MILNLLMEKNQNGKDIFSKEQDFGVEVYTKVSKKL